jgi:hypothetical protein
MVDIEGGEFDLLDEAFFAAFRQSIVFVELHDCSTPTAPSASRGSASGRRALSPSPSSPLRRATCRLSAELSRLSDDDRWILCSEGRGRRMTWWRLEPRNS